MLVYLAIITFAALPQFVDGWGKDTHETIGYLAERFLLNETVPFPQPHGVLMIDSSNA
jgi:hypothetical protein